MLTASIGLPEPPPSADSSALTSYSAGSRALHSLGEWTVMVAEASQLAPAGISCSKAELAVATTLPLARSTSVNATDAPAAAALLPAFVMLADTARVADAAAAAALPSAVRVIVDRATRPSCATWRAEVRTSRAWR